MTSSNLKRKVDPTSDSQPQPEASSNDDDGGLKEFLTQHHPADQIMQNAKDRLPHTYFHTAKSSPGTPHTLLPKKIIIDLTQDDLIEVTDDYLLAQQLQAQFDTEHNELTPPGSPSKKQKRILPTFDSHLEQSVPQSWSLSKVPYDDETTPAITDEEMARTLQAEMDAEDENWATEAKYQVAEANAESRVDSTLALDTQMVHELAESVYQRRCPCCHAALTHDLEQLVRAKHKELLEEKSISGTILCKFCNFAICAGCGQKPEPTQMGRQNERYKEYLVGWHCDDSRRFVLWTLLCMPGQAKAEPRVRAPVTDPRGGRHRQPTSSGVGYGNRGNEHRNAQPVVYHANNQEDVEILPVLVALLEALPNWQKESAFDRVPLIGLLNAIFRRSPLLERIARLLRNDSIHDIAQRHQLYHAVITFLTALAHHSATASLLFQTRHLYPDNHSLMAISMLGSVAQEAKCRELTSSLAQLLENQVSQARSFLTSAQRTITAIDEDQELQDAILICERFSELGEFLDANNNCTIDRPVSGKGKAKVVDDMNEWFRENCVTEVDDTLMMKHHYFASSAAKVVNPPRGRMKKLLMELTSLRTSLPPGIYVKHASSRIDVMKFMIIGPMGTPYENGLFEFDLFCPGDYPQSPPQVQFKTTGKGRAHFNPNLYRCGKVCLSLLGTWSGEPWRADQSTLLQVFVSIQSMVLCDEPWANEPGREFTRGTLQSLKYNNSIRKLTTEHSLIPWAKELKESKDDQANLWASVIYKHFSINVDRIIYTTVRWAQDAAGLSKAPVHHSPTHEVLSMALINKLAAAAHTNKHVTPAGAASSQVPVGAASHMPYSMNNVHLPPYNHSYGKPGPPTHAPYSQLGPIESMLGYGTQPMSGTPGYPHVASALHQGHPEFAANGISPQPPYWWNGHHDPAAFSTKFGAPILAPSLNHASPIATSSKLSNAKGNTTNSESGPATAVFQGGVATIDKEGKSRLISTPNGPIEVRVGDLLITDFPCNPKILPPRVRAKLNPMIWQQSWKPVFGPLRLTTSLLWDLLDLTPKEILWISSTITTDHSTTYHPKEQIPWPGMHMTAMEASPPQDQLNFNFAHHVEDSDIDYSDSESLDANMLSIEALASMSASMAGTSEKQGSGAKRSSFESLAHKLGDLLCRLPQGNTSKLDLVQGYKSHVYRDLPQMIKSEQARVAADKKQIEIEKRQMADMQEAQQASAKKFAAHMAGLSSKSDT